MAIQFGAYSFLDVNATIAGPGGNFLLSEAGLSEEGIIITQLSERDVMTMGARGDGMHSLRASRAVRVAVSLLKTGNGNAQLNSMFRYQSLSSSRWGSNIITVTNAVTGDSAVASGGAFVKHADLAYRTEGGLNVWEFMCINSEQFLGDSFQTTGGV